MSGEVPTRLLNTVSDAVNAALTEGLEVDAISTLLCVVAADYARMTYGDDYLV